MTAVVLRGDARRLPLPDASVDLIVTSPPYFGLRSYTDTCRVCLDVKANGLVPAETLVDWEKHVRIRHHYDGQIGSEATPAEWVAALVECTREWVRVLKPTGSLFVNLGDKYNSGPGDVGGNSAKLGYHLRKGKSAAQNLNGDRSRTLGATVGPKSLLGLPWRYALACTDQLGLILRRDIIWAKPNGLPESVTDRCRSSHEYLFHLVKQPRYYAAVDEIREPHIVGTATGPARRLTADASPYRGAQVMAGNGHNLGLNPLGKLPGSVWEIPSAPLTVPPHLGVDHFAAFPPALVRPVVLGWSPPGICVACGEGRRPITDVRQIVQDTYPRNRAGRIDGTGINSRGINAVTTPRTAVSATITGYTCACRRCICGPDHTGEDIDIRPDCPVHGLDGWPPPPTRPAVVLDPFGGTGTTALVATVHGRHGISIDLSADYCRLAQWRIHDPGERARALQVPKPPPVMDGQDALFAI